MNIGWDFVAHVTKSNESSREDREWSYGDHLKLNDHDKIDFLIQDWSRAPQGTRQLKMVCSCKLPYAVLFSK